MRRFGVIRWIALLAGVVALGVAGLVFGARFADGPIGALPGGPFRSGEWVDDPDVDWSFAQDVIEIEMQSGTPLRSRTTWILVLEGQAYVPCSLGFPPFKHWHRDAMKEPDSVVRIDGRRYRRSLRKVEDPVLHQRLFDAAQLKYPGGPLPEPSRVWFFQLDGPS